MLALLVVPADEEGMGLKAQGTQHLLYPARHTRNLRRQSPQNIYQVYPMLRSKYVVVYILIFYTLTGILRLVMIMNFPL